MRLKDIAEKAGVSISTVSRVLNNQHTKAASPKVQKLIWDIAREMRYIPNKSARELRMNSVTSEDTHQNKESVYCLITRPTDETQSDPFYTRILAGIDRAAFSNGYVMEYTFQLKDIENGTIDFKMKNKQKSCLITIGRYEPKLLNRISTYFKSIVSIALNEMNLSYDQVICNGNNAAQEAVKYLSELGHTKIGFIGDKNESRFIGYTIAMRLMGFDIDNKCIVTDASFSMDGGIIAMKKLLAKGGKPTAIFCANDRTAIGVLRACKENNIRVPEDISIIGMNDIDTTQYVTPMLTTIHVPCEELGKVAFNILLDRLNDRYSLPMTINLPFYFVKRESCAPPSNNHKL